MSQNPTAAPPEPPTDDSGPRVGRDELRDLGRMRRSRTDRKVAGVAAGIARHLDIDPLVVRVALVVLTLFGGAGVLLYAVCWLIVPSEGADDATVRLDERSRTVALAVVAVLALLALIGDGVGGFGFPWPLFVVGLIVLAVMAWGDRSNRASRPPAPPMAPAYPAGPPQPGYPAYPPQPGYPAAPPSFAKPAAPPPVPPMPRTPDPRRRGPVLFWYALATIALALGVLGMVELAGVDVAGSAYPGLALAICAVTLLVGAFWGRAGGVILLGFVAAAATAGATAVEQVDAGRIAETPTSASALAPSYELFAGRIELDLTEVADPDALDGRTVDIDLDLGSVYVVVPDGVDVVVESRVDGGRREIDGLETSNDGGETLLPGGAPDAPTLELDITVGLGEIQVVQEGTIR